jgi:excisionase family DNA binding protein
MYALDKNKDRLMTVKEVAYYLKISISKVYAMANAHEIPAVRVGKSWRFKQEMIDDWIQQGCSSLK